MTTNTSISYRKGQFNITYTDDAVERLNFIFHANTLVPLRDTLHFGIKPGHFMLYVKPKEQEGRWLVQDAGYVNYFRVDQTQVIQTEYNTLQKQKLLSRGFLTVKKLSDTRYKLSSNSILPVHRRVALLDLKDRTLNIEDVFLGKSSIYFNTDEGLVTDVSWFKNNRTFSW